MQTDPKIFHVLSLVPAPDVSQKPSELIQIRGHETLSLNARRAITILWHNAHRQGIEDHKDYTIEIDRLMPSHRGHERAVEVVMDLMTTVLEVTRANGDVTRVQFLGGNDMASKNRPAGLLTYSFDKRLVRILRDSLIWGKIPLEELTAFGSKYTIPLFEHLCQLTGLSHKTSHTFTIEEFRQVLGVEEEKYHVFGALNQRVIKPAVAEINALAQFNVAVVPTKTGKKVTHIRVNWWAKTLPERKDAYRELNRPRVGRKARINNQVEMVFAPAPSEERLAARAKIGERGVDVVVEES